jgi:hypothetical protein
VHACRCSQAVKNSASWISKHPLLHGTSAFDCLLVRSHSQLTGISTQLLHVQ